MSNIILECICDIYKECHISEFGFDLKEICKKLEINLIAYDQFEENANKFYKFDEDAFNIINFKNNKCEIYYNDKIRPKERIKFTIPHEIGHIVLGHHTRAVENETKAQKKEADEFARQFYVPEAFLIHYNLKTISDLMSNFGITSGYAEVILDRFNQRRNKVLTEQESRLIEIFENNKKSSE